MAREPFNPDLAAGGAGEIPSRGERRIFSVGEITQRVKQAIETALPATVHVAGELSNCKHHSSGHYYFTLKDEASELTCVMWRADAAKLAFKLADGMDVIVTGSVSVFERTGRYQLYARRIEPRGLGAIELAFRQLCEKLRKEALFEAHHKKPLPAYPQRIAVITSPTGAAVRDILDTLARRYPCAMVYLYPVVVQGPDAARSVARAVRELNRRGESLGGIDVMIVGRGGGSAEDLAAFNDEALARAIFASRIPVISAVGHETDVTIADLVADVRAATPTAAAELAAPRAVDVLDEFSFRASRLGRSLRHRLELCGAKLASVAHRRALADPFYPMRERSAQCAYLAQRTQTTMATRIHRAKLRIQELATVVPRIHPQHFLVRKQARLANAQHVLERALAARLRAADRSLTVSQSCLQSASPVRGLPAQHGQLRELERRMQLGMHLGLRRRHERVQARAALLTAMGYRETLRRGFSITRHKRSGKLVNSREDVVAGNRLVTETAGGVIESRVVDELQGDLFD